MTQQRVVYFNGKIVPESQASISFRDAGFTRGDAVYDSTRTFDGRIFQLEEHLDRLYRSLKYMRIDPGVSKEEMADLTKQVVETNLPLLGENEDYWVSQRVTRGVDTPDGLEPTVLYRVRSATVDPEGPLLPRRHARRDAVDTPDAHRSP